MAADPALADLTTLRLGGPARRYVAAPDPDALVAAVSEAERAGEPVLVVGAAATWSSPTTASPAPSCTWPAAASGSSRTASRTASRSW
ncbi:hypothetical protein [Nocardioides humi]|uniref:hypothetical protein n=1 Tax=Nocardioides humi TaxID=449461 RepID=UPI00319E1BEE